MKIGIDVSIQCMPRSGIGQYQYNLLKNLFLIDKENTYCLYAFNYRWRHKFNQLQFKANNYKLKVTPLPQRLVTLWWLFLRYPHLEMVTEPCDVYQTSEICVQPSKKGKIVAFIHDLTTILYPEYHMKQNIFFYNRRFQDIEKYADCVLTNSENTKRDILKHLHIHPEKIFVTPFGANDSFRPLKKEETKEVLSRHGIHDAYILFVGTLEPRKNIKTLIMAFNKVKQKLKCSHKLILVGRPGWFYEEIMQARETSDFRDDIVFKGYVADEDLPAFYNGADVFVYPSFYEGFGMPVLEAMQCGTPVITSNISSLPEVGGGACLYIDPNSQNDLEKKLIQVISDSELQKKLSQKGKERAAHFSWKKCAEQTLRAYKKTATG